MLLSRRLWRLYRFYNRLVYLDIFIRVSIKFIGTKIRIYSNKKKQSLSWLSICRGDRIRTCDPLLPKQMRYRTALRPENELQNWWRREGDSNPRYSIPYDSLANCWCQPLTHLSNCADKSSAFYCSCKLLT